MLSTALLQGLLLGMFMAISVGPTLFAVLKYSVNHSYKAGLAFVLGVSISDILFVTIANMATPWLEWFHQYERTMKYGFSALLIGIGLYGLLKKYKPQRPKARVINISNALYAKIFFSGFAMNTFNPALILQWIAVATLMAKETNLYRIVFFAGCLGLVLGIDTLKVFLADIIRRRLTLRRTMYLNRISALFIFGFGVAILALAIFNIELKAPELKKKQKTAYEHNQFGVNDKHPQSLVSLQPHV
jgi:threonine/homoserine/homoserine lactone efflux protein